MPGFDALFLDKRSVHYLADISSHNIFSLGGAFANVSYTDILGKSIDQSTRKSFFSVKQVVGGVMLLFSALLAKR